MNKVIILKGKIKLIITFILGGIICSVISVSATLMYQANQVKYTKSNNEEVTLDSALNELYGAANSLNTQLDKYKICQYVGNVYGSSNNHYSLGTEYLCDVNLNGSGKKNFYVLNVTGDTVTLIMKQNITQGTSKTKYSYSDAVKYVKAMNWKVKAYLPSAQDIADAVGNTSWKVEDKLYTDWFCFGGNFNQACNNNSGLLKNDANTLKYQWLFNYTSDCENSGCLSSTSLGSSEANGYWTRDLINESEATSRAWGLYGCGGLGYYGVINANAIGVRPVITILKSNLYE